MGLGRGEAADLAHGDPVADLDAEGNEQEIATFYNDGYGEKSRILLSTDYTGVVDG